ncbi:hypothetical protein HW561_14090 [Rhodobacteraceae bacterium B1Z28]|uniref:Uncharacterized protein n=1 Tax=Ruegeria haliotis TaxID=2747601 RepID=A0ABX2PS13_9RHOB|nr:hypothetical protein [Ruegeria haliotis]NVO56921.1 hypothetical protein [Ruegeria haliotis]
MKTRPIPYIHPQFVMLRRGPSNLPFAANAKSQASQIRRIWTKLAFATLAPMIAFWVFMTQFLGKTHTQNNLFCWKTIKELSIEVVPHSECN